MLNATVDKAVILARIGKKLERAAAWMGHIPATGTQAVLRCNGKVVVRLPGDQNAN